MTYQRRRSSADSRGKCGWCWIRRDSAYGLTPGMVVGQLQSANNRGQSGSFARDNREFQVEAGLFFTRVDDLRQVVIGVRGGRPVYLRDVVESLEDGPAEPDNYVLFANAKGTSGQAANPEYDAVTITLAKRRGTNASIIAENVLEKINALRGYMLHEVLNVTISRRYGGTAMDK